jgi:hypothetical protein
MFLEVVAERPAFWAAPQVAWVPHPSFFKGAGLDRISSTILSGVSTIDPLLQRFNQCVSQSKA